MEHWSPEGNGPDHSWQKDCGQNYCTSICAIVLRLADLVSAILVSDAASTAEENKKEEPDEKFFMLRLNLSKNVLEKSEFSKNRT